MAAAVRSVSTDSASADADTSLVPAAPAGMTAGDVLVAFGFLLQSRTLSPPDGFTQRQTDANSSYRAYLWTKTAAGGDDLTFTASGTFGQPSVGVVCVSGGTETGVVSALAKIDVNDNAPASPTVTTTAANALILSMHGSALGQSSTLAGPTEDYDITGGSFGTHLASYSEVQASAGASPGRTAATSGFARWIATTISINESGGGGDVTAPTITARSVNAAGTTLALTASETISAGAGGNGGVVLTASGGAVTLAYAAGSGSTSVTYTTSRAILSGETLTLAYTQPGNGWEDTAGNDLATFSGAAVTNNSTQTGGGTGGPFVGSAHVY